MSIDNGGPAFPTTKRFTEKYSDEAGYARVREVREIVGGMTLRDYFAAKALPSIIIVCVDDPRGGKDYPEYCAEQSYLMADAMLKARNK